MGDSSKTEKTKKTSFFRGVKQEFKKIAWPTKDDVIKQTSVVTVVTIIMCILIVLVDMAAKYGVDFVTNL